MNLSSAIEEYLSNLLHVLEGIFPDLSKCGTIYKVIQETDAGAVSKFDFESNEAEKQLSALHGLISGPQKIVPNLLEQESFSLEFEKLRERHTGEFGQARCDLLLDMVQNSLVREYILAFGGLRPDQSNIALLARNVSKYISEGRFSVKTIRPILGINGDLDISIDLGKEIFLKNLTIDTLSLILDRYSHHALNMDQALPYYRYTFERVEEICLFDEQEPRSATIENQIEIETMTRCLAGLVGGPVSAKAEFILPATTGEFIGSGSFHGFGFGAYRPSDNKLYGNLDSFESQTIHNFYSLCIELKEDVWLDTILKRIEIASNRASRLDKLLDAVICLEMIFFANEKSSGYELKNRAAKALGSNLQDRINIFEQLTKIIAIRNAIVHDGGAINKKLQQFESDFGNQADEAAVQYAREGLQFRVRWHRSSGAWPSKYDFRNLILT